MLDQAIVHATLVTSPSDQALPAELNQDMLFTGFIRLASAVLQRTTPMLDFTDPANRYSLRTRPNPMIRLDLQQTLPQSGERVVMLA
jgi:hypothetical protein